MCSGHFSLATACSATPSCRNDGHTEGDVTRFTYTLTKLGYLNYVKRLGKYELAPTILALGYPFLSNLRIRRAAHDPMQQLADAAEGWVALASRSGLKMIFVDTYSATKITTLRIDVGSRVSMVRSAVGRAFLGGISDMRETTSTSISRAGSAANGWNSGRRWTMPSSRCVPAASVWRTAIGITTCGPSERRSSRRMASRSWR